MTWMRIAPISSTTGGGSPISTRPAGMRQDEDGRPESRGRQPRVTPLATLLHALDGPREAKDVPAVEEADREILELPVGFPRPHRSSPGIV